LVNGEFRSHGPKFAEMLDQQKLTDPCSSFFFFVLVGLTIWCSYVSFQDGDVKKLFQSVDWQGRICGIDVPGEYLYFCRSPAVAGEPVDQAGTPGSIDLLHPICVTSCPMGNQTQSSCSGSVVLDYATYAWAMPQRVCIPQAPVLIGMYSAANDDDVFHKYLSQFAEIVWQGSHGTQARWLVLMSFFVAVGLCYVYLLLTLWFANIVIWALMILMVILPAASGGYLLHACKNGGVDGFPGSGDSSTDMWLGVVCCCVSFVFLLVACAMAKTVGKAIICVEKACQCLFADKSLLFEPLLNSFIRIFLWGFFIVGAIWILSMGVVQKRLVNRQTTNEELVWQILLAFDIFMLVFVEEFLSAISHYAFARGAANWYLKTSNGCECCVLGQGYCTGIAYHLGSLTKGSVFIAVLTVPRLLVSLLTCSCGGVENQNPVCICCTACLKSCKGCEGLVFMNMTGFVNMALTTKDFTDACQDAGERLSKEGAFAVSMTGMTSLFSWSGAAFVSFFSATIMSFVVQKEGGPYRLLGVQDPMVLAACAGVIGFVVASSFTIAFDSVSEALLLLISMEDEECNLVFEEEVEVKEQPTQAPGFFSCGRVVATLKKGPLKRQYRPIYDTRRVECTGGYTEAEYKEWNKSTVPARRVM